MNKFILYMLHLLQGSTGKMSATPSNPSQENASILENVQVKIEKGSPELNPLSIPLPDPLIPVTSIKVEVDSMKKK